VKGRKKREKKIFSAIDFSVSVFPSFFSSSSPLPFYLYFFEKKSEGNELSEMIGASE
jgi:hypothetical protein